MSKATHPANHKAHHPETGKPKAIHRKRSQRKDEAVQQPIFEPNAAGIDIGAREVFAAVPADRDEHPVRTCETFTSDLHQLAEWLKACGITTAAMESTGVYWIPVYEVLEQHGIKPCLVNPRNMKNVPGKRTDYHECQWIQHLHSAFRPEAEVCAVRTLMRERNDLVQICSQHVFHMQKALTQTNVQFQHVVSDITGTTGMAILDAIVSGERNPTELAKLRGPRVRASEETIRKSLEGNWQEEHILVLKRRLTLYRIYKEQISNCDEEIEKRIAAMEPKADPEQKPMPEDRKEATAAQEEKREAGLRHADGSLQATRSRSDADPWADGTGADAVQRSGARYDVLADGGTIRLVAGALPRQ